MGKIYQQGDVIIEQITSPIEGKKLEHCILAQGEVTGHSHTITKGEAELFEEKDGRFYLRVKSDKAELTHQEHKTITIPKGDYIVRKVREYDHFLEESKFVKD